ncbi:MAG: hypothetical protein LBI91_03965 [Spirochaetaceae bacterium]|nr:hypothetical protein [Spirochaetaceae bacterium]
MYSHSLSYHSRNFKLDDNNWISGCVSSVIDSLRPFLFVPLFFTVVFEFATRGAERVRSMVRQTPDTLPKAGNFRYYSHTHRSRQRHLILPTS